MRVAIADDNDLWRSSLASALSSRGLDVAFQVSTGEEMLSHLADQDIPIDVAILDLRLPPTWSDEGIALAHHVRAARPHVGIIMLSGYEQDVQLHYASRALSSLQGDGGVGYLFKDRTSRDILANAVQRVATGGLVVDPIFAQEAAEEYRRGAEARADLTSREVEVLEMLTRGLTNREIATALFISQPVVERHITSIFNSILPAQVRDQDGRGEGRGRGENRRVLAVLEWLRRTGRLS